MRANEISYNIPVVMLVQGNLVREKCERAFEIIIKRHEPFRSAFLLVDGEPVQKIIKDVSFQLEWFVDVSEEAVEEIISSFVQPFDLSTPPLLRCGVIKLTPDKHILMLDTHHIIADGVSTGILLDEFVKLYHGQELPPLTIQYKDFAAWQNIMLESADVKKQKEYWVNRFEDEIPVLNLRTDYVRPFMQSFAGERIKFSLDEITTKELRRIAKENDATLYMILLAIYNVLLSKYTGQEDIIIGSPTSGRSGDEVEHLIGMFVNTLALRNFPKSTKSFLHFLKEVRENALQAFENQDFQFDKLIEHLDIERDMSRNPLFDTMLILQNKIDYTSYEIEGLSINPYDFETGVSKFDITLECNERHERLDIYVEYAIKLFHRETIERLIKHFKNLVQEVITDPTQLLSELTITSLEEEKQILKEFNVTEKEYPTNLTITEFFERRVKEIPDQIAVLAGDRALTYRQINEKANQLAHFLQEHGVEVESVVAILADRSPEMIIAILAILKAGGAYIPIDPKFSDKRITYLLEDSKVKILLSDQGGIAERIDWYGNIYSLFDECIYQGYGTFDLSPLANSSNLAYIIYTSGSTGKPKGTMIEHRSVVNILQTLEEMYPLKTDDAYLMKTTFTFDVSVTELFGWFFGFGKVVILAEGDEKDPKSIIEAIREYQVTHINFVPSMFSVFLEALAQCDIKVISNLSYIFVAGEEIKAEIVKNFRALNTGVRLENLYGPTESTIYSIGYSLNQLKDEKIIPIGKPLSNIKSYILNADQQLQPIGVPGELYLGGAGLARGYLNRDDLTQKLFIANPLAEKGEMVKCLYRTGDLVRWLPEGNIEYLGRIDSQVKIRGFRIELGEIEKQILSHPFIKEAVVTASPNKSGEIELIAYYTTEQMITVSEWREFLSEELPAYMIPAYFVPLGKIPVGTSGKLDSQSLPAPYEMGLTLQNNYTPPKTKIESMIIDICKEVLHFDHIGIHNNFFDLGASSLDIIRIHTRIKDHLQSELSVAKMFRYPTVSQLAGYLSDDDTDIKYISDEIKENKTPQKIMTQSNEIAVVGMAGRFPGANTLKQFWENLTQGVESITLFTEKDLQATGVTPSTYEKHNYVKARGIIEGVEYFDASFFDYTAKEIELMDPQLRILHECVWEALEDAGYTSDEYEGLIGLYTGSGANYNWLQNIGAFSSEDNSILINSNDFNNTRIAYKFNFKGPSVTIQTACSTSLVSIDTACQGLLHGKCDIALAGGVGISYPQQRGYFYEEGMIFSPDGHCRAFDAKAAGAVQGNGAGIVALKRLEDALNDGDRIYAVIKGTAVNNDGMRKVGYTAPSVSGQAEVIRQAHQVANVSSESIGYIEAHGTGTSLGDPIEIEGLTEAFGSEKRHFCAIGSVKTNIGHLDTASGVASFIKTVLSLQYKQIPPTLHFEEPNPKIDFANSPFYVNEKLEKWEAKHSVRRAGVSSFGIGGTNAHVILEEAPLKELDESGKPLQLITLSAKTETALQQMTVNLFQYMSESKKRNLADIAYSLQVGRKEFPHRKIFIARDCEEFEMLLNSETTRMFYTDNKQRPVIFMFSGQGSQYINMGLELYQMEGIFRETINHCADLLLPNLGVDVRQILYPQNDGESILATERMKKTEWSQPIIFIFEYSIACLLMQWGIQPSALIGYSFGEFVAACLADVISLEDALYLIVERARLMQQTSTGTMLNVPVSMEKVIPLLSPDVSLAIDNGHSCVVAGSYEAIATFEEKMKEHRYLCMRINVTHAAHSILMDPILATYEKKFKGIKLRPPRIPFLSNVTGDWITAEQATSPNYWVEHLRKTVRFSDCLKRALETDQVALIEIGPGNSLITVAKQHESKKSDQLILNTVRHQQEQQGDLHYLLHKVGLLWASGVHIDWKAFYYAERRQRLSLPNYPFERQYFWGYSEKKDNFEIESKRKGEITDWFYFPSWERSMQTTSTELLSKSHIWLLFIDEFNIGIELAEHLRRAGQQVITVKMASRYAKINAFEYMLPVQAFEGYTKLINDLLQDGMTPDQIVHMWSTTKAEELEEKNMTFVEEAQQRGFYSLLQVTKALGVLPTNHHFQITMISNHMHEIAGDTILHPEKSTLLGLSKVIGQEFPNIRCRSIDIVLPVHAWEQKSVVSYLLMELTRLDTVPLVAYRGHQRFVQSFIQIKQTKQQTNFSRLRQKGVYLITGGLGSIGYSFSEHLAEVAHAKLILTGRSPMPPRDIWDDFLYKKPNDPISNRILKVRRLEQLGAEVLLIHANVANQIEMEQAIQKAENHFGVLNGVIHAAGIVEKSAFKPIIDLTPNDCQPQFNAKLYGLLVLENVLADRQLDFCYLMSSLASLLGGLGYSAYAASNSFVDAFVYKHNKNHHVHWTSINCEGWKATDENAQKEMMRSTLSDLLISPEEGVEIFKHILSMGNMPQVIVSSGDLNSRLEQWVMPSLREAEVVMRSKKSSATFHSRPDLSTPYVEPGNKQEHTFVEIWKDYMGLKQVGVLDNFFELGVSSLDLIQISQRLKHHIDKEISVVDMFSYPTIRLLVAHLQSGEEGNEKDRLEPQAQNSENSVNANKSKLNQRRQKLQN